MRASARLCWRGYLLVEITNSLLDIWEARFSAPHEFFTRYKKERSFLFTGERTSHLEILRRYSQDVVIAEEIPGSLARGLIIEEFQRQVSAVLSEMGLQAVLLFDGLDEGWEPTVVSAAALGGLAIALSDFADAKTPLHGVVFVRDNMMRALAHFDNDFSRHIEGNTLRLHWEELSLLHLVASRLRVALGIEQENDIKVWNRFAQQDLRDRTGFRKCLERTLYRPRDILVLLNRAYVSAARTGRPGIVLADIQSASRNISTERLSDLLKEYDVVLPGLELFVDVFRDRHAVTRLGSLMEILGETIDESRLLASPKARDFALLGSSRDIIGALYAVGFIGLRDRSENKFVFCHDGSLSSTDDWSGDREVIVHPCYWEALNISESLVPLEVATSVTDEYTPVPADEVKDIRTRGIGKVLGELASIPSGRDGARAFEQWVLRVVQILFQGDLTNFEAKPNSGAVSQRDIVATNMATKGFWHRVLSDYGSRQVIFEVKNYAEITNDDLRQVLSYSIGEYGRFSVVVIRCDKEGFSPITKAWLREMYHEHKRLMLLMPTVTLQRCLEKLRTVRKHDYTEKQMTKRLDDLVRRYVVIPSGRSPKRR